MTKVVNALLSPSSRKHVLVRTEMGQAGSLPLYLHGLLPVRPITDPVLSACADAQDHIDVVHPGTLHLLCILTPFGICANPVRAQSCLMILITPVTTFMRFGS